jgi:hypothetical protein
VELLRKQIEESLALRPDLVEQTESEEELLQLIERLIEELINHDFEKLLLILYRLDVSEAKVKKAIDDSGPALASRRIAELILAREKAKIHTREKYSSGETDWEF